MFGISGAGLNKIKNMQSGGVRHRWSVDQWDKVGQRRALFGTSETSANPLAAKYGYSF